MRRTTILALLVMTALVLTTSAVAQNNCKDFRAMYRMYYEFNLVTGEGYGWTIDSGGIVALLDGKVSKPTITFLPGVGTSFWTGRADGMAGVGHDKGQMNVWDLGNGNTFTTGDWHAVYPNQPANTWMPEGLEGESGTLYVYNGTGKIVAGTGDFASTGGTLTETGPYLQWLSFEGDTPFVHGMYHALIVARICTR